MHSDTNGNPAVKSIEVSHDVILSLYANGIDDYRELRASQCAALSFIVCLPQFARCNSVIQANALSLLHDLSSLIAELCTANRRT